MTEPPRLVVLSSKLDRLGPSIPWRYQARSPPPDVEPQGRQPRLCQPRCMFQQDAWVQRVEQPAGGHAAELSPSGSNPTTAPQLHQQLYQQHQHRAVDQAAGDNTEIVESVRQQLAAASAAGVARPQSAPAASSAAAASSRPQPPPRAQGLLPRSPPRTWDQPRSAQPAGPWRPPGGSCVALPGQQPVLGARAQGGAANQTVVQAAAAAPGSPHLRRAVAVKEAKLERSAAVEARTRREALSAAAAAVRPPLPVVATSRDVAPSRAQRPRPGAVDPPADVSSRHQSPAERQPWKFELPAVAACEPSHTALQLAPQRPPPAAGVWRRRGVHVRRCRHLKMQHHPAPPARQVPISSFGGDGRSSTGTGTTRSSSGGASSDAEQEGSRDDHYWAESLLAKSAAAKRTVGPAAALAAGSAAAAVWPVPEEQQEAQAWEDGGGGIEPSALSQLLRDFPAVEETTEPTGSAASQAAPASWPSSGGQLKSVDELLAEFAALIAEADSVQSALSSFG
jgi:hypothetical protein